MKYLAYKFVTWALSYNTPPNQSADLDKIVSDIKNG